MFYRCLSVHRVGGGGVHQQADTPSPEMATAVDGTHPTGMHSCYTCLSVHRGKGGMISLPAWSHVLRGVRWGRGSVSRESLPLGRGIRYWPSGISGILVLAAEGHLCQKASGLLA